MRRQRRGEKLLLVALTGYANEEYRKRSYQVGFDHFLVKPIAPDTLKVLLAGGAPGQSRELSVGKGLLKPDGHAINISRHGLAAHDIGRHSNRIGKRRTRQFKLDFVFGLQMNRDQQSSADFGEISQRNSYVRADSRAATSANELHPSRLPT